MKQSLLTAIVLLVALAPFSAHSRAACKEKRKAMHGARVSLKECNKSWTDSIRGDATDPADDCSAKQSAFIAGVKEFKACVKEEKEKAQAKQ
jgi:hypothetical protein